MKISRDSVTIQTHSGVNILANANSPSAWIEATGYSDLAITLMNDAVASSIVYLQWSNDGVSQHGEEAPSLLPSATNRYRSAQVPIKARYFKISIQNADATSPHIMSCWVYLKT